MGWPWKSRLLRTDVTASAPILDPSWLTAGQSPRWKRSLTKNRPKRASLLDGWREVDVRGVEEQ